VLATKSEERKPASSKRSAGASDQRDDTIATAQPASVIVVATFCGDVQQLCA
jgi:hypothetical protein